VSQLRSAVGMVEFTSIAAGIDASDRMVKAAAIQPIFFKSICPGKFIAAIAGDVSAVKTSVEAGRLAHPTSVVDWFVISNIHPDVVRSLTGTCDAGDRRALGVIETFSAVTVVQAADAAVKAAAVRLVDVRIALALGGKGYVLVTGDVGACRSSVEAGARIAAERGLLVQTVVIPSPSDEVFRRLA
jgi:microcompartment protein CcmL/EutN